MTIAGNVDDAIAAIESLIDSRHDYQLKGRSRIDFEDRRQQHRLDVWAAEIDAPDGEMLWRARDHVRHNSTQRQRATTTAGTKSVATGR